jgi:hypothetical protein
VIEGVSNGPELRDRVFERLRASRSAGLGDEARTDGRGARSAGATGFTAEHVEALREILSLVRQG